MCSAVRTGEVGRSVGLVIWQLGYLHSALRHTDDKCFQTLLCARRFIVKPMWCLSLSVSTLR